MTIQSDLAFRQDRADQEYGDFTSAHEALGVITEDFHELIAAIHDNAGDRIRNEALDLAAACLRLALACEFPRTHEFKKRSNL